MTCAMRVRSNVTSGALAGRRDATATTLGVGPRADALDAGPERFRERARLAVQRDVARLGVGEQAQVLHKLRQVKHLLVDGGESLRVRFEHAVAKRLDVALHVREGRSQLVGDVRDEVAALALGSLQVVGHAIEGTGKLADLVPSARVHPLRQVARAHAARGRRERAHRPQGATRHERHEQQAAGAGDDSGPQQGAVGGLGEPGPRRLLESAGVQVFELAGRRVRRLRGLEKFPARPDVHRRLATVAHRVGLEVFAQLEVRGLVEPRISDEGAVFVHDDYLAPRHEAGPVQHWLDVVPALVALVIVQ